MLNLRTSLPHPFLLVFVGVPLAFFSWKAHSQDTQPLVRLPNPYGEAAVFDRSNQNARITIEFNDLTNSNQIFFSDLSGNLRLINFWATWCGPCIQELPSLAALQSEFARDSLQVITVSQDRAGSKTVSEFVSNLDAPGLEWFIDHTGKSAKEVDAFVLPTSIIVNGQDEEIGRVVGSADWSSSEALSLIRSLLSEVIENPK